MPPAVDPGLPPTNISSIVTTSVAGRIDPVSTLLNPAVRGVAPWKNDATSFSPGASGPSVAGFVHSSAATASVASASRPAETPSTSRACSVRRRRARRASRPTSISTWCPSPPTTKPTATTRSTVASPAKPARLSA